MGKTADDARDAGGPGLRSSPWGGMPAAARDGSTLVLLFVLFVLPLVVLLISSLSSVWTFPRLLPEGLSGRAYGYAASQGREIFGSLLTSTGYSLLTVAAVFFMTILPARALARWEFPGKHLLDALLLVPVLLPAMTFSMGIHVVFIRTGLSDTLPGIVLVLSIYSYPYMLRALISAYM
ncbi:MAG: ABC transporter, partial [Spirochaetota bacterium]|nr:ABC transporter [Spirochaetota bacterium]